MDQKWRRALRAFLVAGGVGLGALSLAGCAKVLLEPATTRDERRSIVRVTLEKVDRDLLVFQVENLSKEPLSIVKTESWIETVVGTITHPPGTKGPVFEVKPGGKQPVQP